MDPMVAANHILRMVVGMGLVAMVVAEYLLFTVAFGPFTLYHAIGMVAVPWFCYYVGKKVIG